MILFEKSKRNKDTRLISGVYLRSSPTAVKSFEIAIKVRY